MDEIENFDTMQQWMRARGGHQALYGSAFFVFGATMLAYAAFTLLKPGTGLDALWRLNQKGHSGLLPLGRAAVLSFFVLSVGRSGVVIVAMNLTGDAVNLFIGQGLKGVAGVVIAGMLLAYMTRVQSGTPDRRHRNPLFLSR